MSLPLNNGLLGYGVQPNLFSIPDSPGPCPMRGRGLSLGPRCWSRNCVLLWKLLSPAPVSILTSDYSHPYPSPEGSCARKTWPPARSLKGGPQIQTSPGFRNSKAQGALERALHVVRGAPSPNPGSAAEQLCNFGQVASPLSALLSTSVKWE